MDNENILNFDSDGDVVADSYAEGYDTNGDGVVDTWLVDTDSDGLLDVGYEDSNADGYEDVMYVDTDSDGEFDALYADTDYDGNIDAADLNMDGMADAIITYEDTNGDGIADAVVTESDTDFDGISDTVEIQSDTNGDGVVDSYGVYTDADGDGVFEAASEMLDTDGDNVIDTQIDSYDYDADGEGDYFRIAQDFDADGEADVVTEGVMLDTDFDGVKDTYVQVVDENADGTYDTVEFYDYDAESGTLELIPLDFFQESENSVDYDNFDPADSDSPDVIGDPDDAMDEWEFQGATNRCAIYSQKFIVEEVTGQEVDIEELADLAEENGWFTEEGGTPIMNMNSILNHYGIENEMSFNNDISDIEQCLEDGGRVIVSVDSGEIWYGEEDEVFSPSDGVDHAVEVIGIDYSDPDNPMVILNDPGTPDGCGMMVPLEVFEDAWEDGDCQMVACE